jgi:hypothetical protein
MAQEIIRTFKTKSGDNESVSVVVRLFSPTTKSSLAITFNKDGHPLPRAEARVYRVAEKIVTLLRTKIKVEPTENIWTTRFSFAPNNRHHEIVNILAPRDQAAERVLQEIFSAA